MDDILIEQEHMPSLDRTSDQKYFIGFCFIDQDEFIIDSRLSLQLFFRNDSEKLLEFLNNHACFKPNWFKIEIFKLYIKNILDTEFFYFSCIPKTFYIKLIQRRWRNIYKKRIQLINNQRFMINFIFKRQRLYVYPKLR